MGRSNPPSICVNNRRYRWPRAPVVVVCLDGSSFDYIEAAIAAGATPYMEQLVRAGLVRTAEAAMPTFTNTNNVSIVTGAPPAQHGITGNFFLDPERGEPVMMSDAACLSADTVPAAFSRRGARVAVICAKAKLRSLLGAGLNGLCICAEQEGQPVYSSQLSEYVLDRGVEVLRATRPDVTYLSTSDYVQHAHPPGSAEANRFYSAIDRRLAALDSLGVRLVVTADHGMQAKTDPQGRPRIVFLQTAVDEWLGPHAATVILPITDPYVAHHASLGSFATIHVTDPRHVSEVVGRSTDLPGIELALTRDAACSRFELPPDRVGDVVVCADAGTVLGTRPGDHDLSLLRGPLRSHGGLAERRVPMLFNQPLRIATERRLKNYDAFWLALNALDREEC